jgi:hypothetical protein
MAKSKSRAKPRRVSSASRKAVSQPNVARKVPARGRASVGAAAKGKPAAKPHRVGPTQPAKKPDGGLRNNPGVVAVAGPTKAAPKAPGPKAVPAGMARPKALVAEAPKAPAADARPGTESSAAVRPAAAIPTVSAPRTVTARAAAALDGSERTGSKTPTVASPPDISGEPVVPPGLPVPIASFTI